MPKSENRPAGAWLALAILVGAGGVTSAVPAQAADGAPQVIYGRDNRSEVFRLNGARAELAAATVALFEGDPQLAGQPIQLSAPTLAEAERLCPGQRFASQPAAAFCSGALVAPDVVLTAGHCIRVPGATKGVPLNQIVFVFGYQMVNNLTAPTSLPGADVYAADALLKRVETGAADYALIRLDRAVTGRRPLRLGANDAPAVDLPVFVIGHPSGLPAKLAGGATITQLRRNLFFANLDTFGGNSGSPVLDARTNRLIGVLDEGEPDYVRRGNCFVVNRLPRLPGREGATRSSVFGPDIAALR